MRLGAKAIETPPRPVQPLDVVSSLAVPVILIDENDNPASANPAAEALLNLSEGTLRERGWLSVVSNDSPLFGIFADARKGEGDFAAYDVEIGLIGGRRFVADILISPLTNMPGWMTLAVQRRAAASMLNRNREQIMAARTAVGVAAMLAHEIKNPLSGIRGAAQLLASDADTELTDLICNEVDRISALIDSMEDFTDTRPLNLVPQNIHSILGHVRKLAEHGFAANIRFEEDYDPSLPDVLGDRNALIQIFINLIKNASEVTGKKQKIYLKSSYRHGLKVAVGGSSRRISVPIEICVIDEGPGAPADIVDHLFDPFVTSKAYGTGLGLAMVAKLVGDHGGLVEYDHKMSPQRTTFRVLLPMAPGK